MRRIIPVLTTLIIVGLLAVSVLLTIGADRNPPKITIVQSLEHYIPTMSQGELLSGVVATDDVDGDVSDTLTIEQVQILSDQGMANIIYVARDRKNNIAKKSILLPVEGIVEEEEEVLEIEVTPTQIPEEEEEETDTEGMDIEDGETPLEEENEPEEEETREPLVSYGPPVIRLSTYEVTINAGDSFKPINYVAEAVDDKDDAWRRIIIMGDYSRKKPGVYTLQYYVTDTDGNKSNIEELILTVR